MQTVNIVVETPVSRTARARQVCSMFDAPPESKARREWSLQIDLDSNPWNIGLVVGPSGSGKSTVMRHLWGEPKTLTWSGASMLDDFDSSLSIEQITSVCGSVGLNSIPSWVKPFSVLSNGEQFRADLARRLVSDSEIIVVDEFTSVVDRQVAQVGSHAVQKYVRKAGKRFVAVTCHYDVADWLQPDWVLDMSTNSFQRRLLQRRPSIACTVGRLPRAAWSMFAQHHYMSGRLHSSSICFGVWVNKTLAGFLAVIPCPISSGQDKGKAIWRIHRVVIMPDYQGIGLSHTLTDTVASEYAAIGRRFRHYPAHPVYTRQVARNNNWRLVKVPGTRSTSSKRSRTSTCANMGGSACAVFEYVGAATMQPRLGIV